MYEYQKGATGMCAVAPESVAATLARLAAPYRTLSLCDCALTRVLSHIVLLYLEALNDSSALITGSVLQETHYALHVHVHLCGDVSTLPRQPTRPSRVRARIPHRLRCIALLLDSGDTQTRQRCGMRGPGAWRSTEARHGDGVSAPACHGSWIHPWMHLSDSGDGAGEEPGTRPRPSTRWAFWRGTINRGPARRAVERGPGVLGMDGRWVMSPCCILQGHAHVYWAVTVWFVSPSVRVGNDGRSCTSLNGNCAFAGS